MERVTVKVVLTAINEIAVNPHTIVILANLDDDKLFKRCMENDLHMLSVQTKGVIEQLSKDKHLNLPNELYKTLPNNVVEAIVDMVN